MISFLFKAVLILFIFSFVVYVFKALSRLTFNVRNTAKEINKMRDVMGGFQGAKSTEMVRCSACGSFVSEQDAMQLKSGGKALNFCSRECLQLHAKTA